MELNGRLRECLKSLEGRRVAVLGDLVVDEFVYGEMKRVYGDVVRTSREVAFGLLLREQGKERRPGGAANAVNNLLALGARPVPLGFVGDDEPGRWLRSHFRRMKVDVSGILPVRGWTTPTKVRIVAGSVQSPAQQILRLDREELHAPSVAYRRRLHARLRKVAARAQALLVADYGYGAAAPDEVNRLFGRRGLRLPAVLDSRYRARDFRGFTVVTPSVPELEEGFRVRLGADARALERATRNLLRETGAAAVLLTRGRHGMLLAERGKRSFEISAFGTDQVADVTGAGDTVAAVVTAALAAGAGFEDATHLANMAGGLVVRKRGTATVTAAELRRALDLAPPESRRRRRAR